MKLPELSTVSFKGGSPIILYMSTSVCSCGFSGYWQDVVLYGVVKDAEEAFTVFSVVLGPCFSVHSPEDR